MIRLIYRSYGGENHKHRPEHYDKDLTLASFIRAARRADVPILFLNDGPIPKDRLAVMQSSGEVKQIADEPVGMRTSYRTAWELPRALGWPPDTLVYFSEDDYLYHPDAFVALSNADCELHDATYFALYGSTNKYANPTEFPDQNIYPAHFRRRPDRLIDGVNWVHIPSTASSFGARAGALAADHSIMVQSMHPFRKRYQDHETCLLYQGTAPFRGTEVLVGGRGSYPWTPWGIARRFGLIPFRVALNVRAWSRRRRPHPLYVAEPNLACHMEIPVMTPGRDWSAIAADTRRWIGAGCPAESAPVTT